MRAPAILCATALSAALAAPARAGEDYFTSGTPGESTVYRVDKHRSKGELALLLSLAGGSLACSGAGLYFHLQSGL